MNLLTWLKQRTNKPYSLVKILLLMLIPMGLFFIVSIIKNRELSRYNLMEFNKSYFLSVQKLKEYRGELFLNDSLKIGAAYDKAIPNPNHLYEYLMVGDSIAKNRNSDSILVIRLGASNKWFIHQSK